jgi:2-polyprenyl-6-methoxyphenol hydroxylase-like FAD-dependent oxidoreductase
MQQAGRALRELGIKLPHDVPSKSHYIFSTNGEIVGFFGRAFLTTDDGKPTQPKKNTFNVHIPRQQLRQMLVERLNPGTIEWGRRLGSYSELPSGDGIELVFEDGSRETAAVLIGADGIRSVVRRQKVADALSYLGVVVVLGIAECRHPLLRERIFETVDGASRLYAMPFDAAGRYMWQLSFPCPEPQARALCAGGGGGARLREEVVRICGAWHAPVPELLAAAAAADMITGYPVYDRQPLSAAACRGRPDSLVSLLGRPPACTRAHWHRFTGKRMQALHIYTQANRRTCAGMCALSRAGRWACTRAHTHT